MSQTLPSLNLRVELGVPLTSAQIDYNFTTIRDFINATAAQIAASLNIDGTIRADAVVTASILDRAVTRPKLALDSAQYFEDTESDGNQIVIEPSPEPTDYAEGMVFYVYLPSTKSSNSGAVTIAIKDGLAAAQVVKPGGYQLVAGELTPNTVICVACVDATNKIFHLVGSLQVGANQPSAISGGQMPYNGSFEIVTTGATVPDGWTMILDDEAGGGGDPTLSIVSSEAGTRSGGKAVKFLLSSGFDKDWISLQGSSMSECVEGDALFLDWRMKITPGLGAGTAIPVRLTALWYKYDGAALAGTPSTNFMNRTFTSASGQHPATWARMIGLVKVPSGARSVKLQVACGEPADTPLNHNNAEVYFDNIVLSSSMPSSLIASGLKFPVATPYSTTWHAPDNVWTALAWCIGAGGSNLVDGGGAGEFAASVVDVVPLTGYPLAIGVDILNQNGGSTTFNTTSVIAIGGGQNGTGGTGGTGTVLIPGGLHHGALGGVVQAWSPIAMITGYYLGSGGNAGVAGNIGEAGVIYPIQF